MLSVKIKQIQLFFIIYVQYGSSIVVDATCYDYKAKGAIQYQILYNNYANRCNNYALQLS